VSDIPTGKAIIMRDDADIRLLINNKENANHSLSLEDIEDHKEDIASCQVLYVSGYCVSDPTLPRFDAALKAMKYAKQQNSEQGPSVIFDVVPHKIYEKVTFDEFLAITQNVDILISEVTTIRRFLGLGSKSEIIDYTMAEDAINRMTTYYSRLILRFGPSGCDEQFLWDKNNSKLLYNKTEHKHAIDKRGFGDLLTIKALQNFFQVLSPMPDQASTAKFATTG
jgi:sugar/nucleoside kinase (ribokinase family)